MTSYLLTYDLSTPGRDYAELTKHLEAYGTYSHCLGSVWLLVTDKTAKEIREAAQKHMDANDKILVVTLTGVASWNNLRDSTSKWIHKHL